MKRYASITIKSHQETTEQIQEAIINAMEEVGFSFVASSEQPTGNSTTCEITFTNSLDAEEL